MAELDHLHNVDMNLQSNLDSLLNKTQYITTTTNSGISMNIQSTNLNSIHSQALFVGGNVTLSNSAIKNFYCNFFRESALTIDASVALDFYCNTYIRQGYNVSVANPPKVACSLVVHQSSIGVDNYSIIANGQSFIEKNTIYDDNHRHWNINQYQCDQHH